MARTKKIDAAPEPNFARHPTGTCAFCDADALQLCAAYQLFVYSGGSEESWRVLRNFVVPGTGRHMNRTVWQLVCAAEGIQEFTGGRYQDGGEVPTPKLVQFAITTGAIA